MRQGSESANKEFRGKVAPGEATALLAGYPAWIVITAIKNDGVSVERVNHFPHTRNCRFDKTGIEYSGVLLGIDA